MIGPRASALGIDLEGNVGLRKFDSLAVAPDALRPGKVLGNTSRMFLAQNRDAKRIRRGWLKLLLGCSALAMPYLAQAQSAGTAPSVEASRDQEPRDITFDDLTFEMEKGGAFERSLLTPKINELDGARIRLRGFIRPSYKQSGISKFVFVRDNQECCFGPGAALYDCVLVELADEQTTDYTVRPIRLVGEFFLKEFKGPDGKIWAIYRMRNAHVE